MTTSAALTSSIRAILSQAPHLDLLKRGVLISNLVFMFHTMRASEDLLELAAELSTGVLKTYFVEHLCEERGHAEWLRADLMSAGVDVMQTSIPRQAVELVGTQMYLIRYLHPCALLGYMTLMECFPMDAAMLDELERAHGKELMRTARHHAEHDIGHGSELLSVIDSLSPYEQAIVIESGTQAAMYFAGALHALAQMNRESNG